MNKSQLSVVVTAFIVSGGCVVRWLTQGVGEDRWLVFAFIAAAAGVAAFAWPERKR